MTELQLKLTEEERAYLTGLLEMVLKDTRVEEHRTRTPSYRADIVHREDVITALLGKLGRPSQVAGVA
jgi:hypothetical protein